jgi:hypothetical protein
MNAQRIFALMLLLLGGVLLANNLLELNISVFKLMLGGGLLLLGIMLLTGRGLVDPTFGAYPSKYNVLFGSAHNRVSDTPEPESFTTVFGEQSIRLDGLTQGGKDLYISSTFSEVKLLLPRDLPVRITASAYFGEAKLPNGQTVNFGEQSFSELHGLSTPAANIRVQVTFGSFKVKWI